MTTFQRVCLLLWTLTFTETVVFAQNNGDAGAACGAVGCGILMYLLFLGFILGLAITLIVVIFRFIKRDALARGMPNASSMPWFALLGLLGLLIYLLMRPQGNVMPCPVCGAQRMQGLPICPHCGRP